MISVVWLWFLKQSKKVKLLIVVIIAVTVFGVVQMVKLELAVRSQNKMLQTKIEQLETNVNTLTHQKDSLINVGLKTTKRVKKASSTIDKKLKQDEKTIDNSTITDDDIADFIAKHQKR